MEKLIALVLAAALASGCAINARGMPVPKEKTWKEIGIGALVVVGIVVVVSTITRVVRGPSRAHVQQAAVDEDVRPGGLAQARLDDAANRAVQAVAADDCDEVERIANEVSDDLGQDAVNGLKHVSDSEHCFQGPTALLLGIDDALSTNGCPKVLRLTKRLGQVDPDALTARIQADERVRACVAPAPVPTPGPELAEPWAGE